MDSRWNGHLDNPYNNRHATVVTNNPDGHFYLKDGSYTTEGEIEDEEISLATWARKFNTRSTLTDLTDQNPYKPLDQTVNKHDGKHNWQIYRYKVYNTYWANQGKYEETRNGVAHYAAKNLKWIVNIVQNQHSSQQAHQKTN